MLDGKVVRIGATNLPQNDLHRPQQVEASRDSIPADICRFLRSHQKVPSPELVFGPRPGSAMYPRQHKVFNSGAESWKLLKEPRELMPKSQNKHYGVIYRTQNAQSTHDLERPSNVGVKPNQRAPESRSKQAAAVGAGALANFFTGFPSSLVSQASMKPPLISIENYDSKYISRKKLVAKKNQRKLRQEIESSNIEIYDAYKQPVPTDSRNLGNLDTKGSHATASVIQEVVYSSLSKPIEGIGETSGNTKSRVGFVSDSSLTNL